MPTSEARKAYNRTYYRNHRDAMEARNLQSRIARGESLPPGQYVGHCGLWHRVDAVPFPCPTCGQRLFESDMASPWMNRRDAAAYCATTVRHLEELAYKGGGPRYYCPRNRMVRYHLSDLDAWMRANPRLHTSDVDGQAARLLDETEQIARDH